MDSTKLNSIIKRKNERLEQDALSSAEELIAEIIVCQAVIKQHEARIVECRQELKALEVEQIDQSEILGGE